MIRNQLAPRVSIADLRVAAATLEKLGSDNSALHKVAQRLRFDADQKEASNSMRRRINEDRKRKRGLLA